MRLSDQRAYQTLPSATRMASPLTPLDSSDAKEPARHRNLVWADCQGQTFGSTSMLELWFLTQNVPIRLTVQRDVNPRIVDGRRRRFHGVFVGHSFTGGRTPCEGLIDKLASGLQQYANNWRPRNITKLEGAQATKQAITDAVNAKKRALRPGDELLFYFCDHGHPGIQDAAPVDEPAGGNDGLIGVAPPPGRTGNFFMTDDELADLLSGFRRSVTITVILDVCHAGGFGDGKEDLLSMTNRAGNKQDKDHLAVMLAVPLGCVTRFQFTERLINGLRRAPRNPRADANGDGITTAAELFDFARQETPRTERPPVFLRGAGRVH